ncbi:MAG: DMT family transporter [Firmicutes bacterium]|nr:DMT family transporter [Bacillota bacterium]
MVTSSTHLVDGVYGRKPWQGFSMALLAAIFWGLSGVSAQWLFTVDHVMAGWLVTTRMGVSGCLILAVAAWKQGIHELWLPWRDAKWRLQLVIFAIVGLFGVQYSYLAAIHDGNAASATLLQYTGPSLITVYIILRRRERPVPRQLVAVGFSLVGTWLLVSGGRLDTLHVAFGGVAWGLLSALALAFYTLYPQDLLQRWGSGIVVGWGMLIGAAGSQLIFPVWPVSAGLGQWPAWIFIGFVVFVGTFLAFWLYLASLNFIEPGPASIITSAEPLVATLASVAWLSVRLNVFQDIGAFSIVAAVVILSMNKKTKNKRTAVVR